MTSRLILVAISLVVSQSAFARVHTCADSNDGVYSPTHSVQGCESEDPFVCDAQTELTCVNKSCKIDNADLKKMTYVGKAREVGGRDAVQMVDTLRYALGGFLGEEEGLEAKMFVDNESRLLVICDAAPVGDN